MSIRIAVKKTNNDTDADAIKLAVLRDFETIAGVVGQDTTVEFLGDCSYEALQRNDVSLVQMTVGDEPLRVYEIGLGSIPQGALDALALETIGS